MTDGPLSAIAYLFHEFMDDRERAITQLIFLSQGCVVRESGMFGDGFYLVFDREDKTSFKATITDSENGFSLKLEPR